MRKTIRNILFLKTSILQKHSEFAEFHLTMSHYFNSIENYMSMIINRRRERESGRAFERDEAKLIERKKKKVLKTRCVQQFISLATER
jgi:hypothetical protein